jgi:hypothetical protein
MADINNTINCEIWKPIKEGNGKYQISNFGNLRRMKITKKYSN